MSGAPWSVKGIDPKAREVAKDLARRSGMTLGEWLNHMIVEGEAPEPPPEPEPGRFARRDPEPVWIEAPRPSQDAPHRYEIAGHPADEVNRVADIMERLSQRIEAAEQRSTLAITGIDQSVRGALSKLERAEREQTAVAARFEGLADELRTDQGRLAEQVRKLQQEASGPRSVEALRALEGALGKVAGHLYEGEQRTGEALAAVEARVAEIEGRGQIDPARIADSVAARIAERMAAAEARTDAALRELGTSFVTLEKRLSRVEAEGGGEARLQELAASLTARLETARAEMADKLRASSDTRFDRMEGKLTEMAGHVAAAEQRQAQAIERMGREVVTLADTLSRRVQSAEGRSATVVEQVGGEVARIAAAMEAKLGRADTVQAQALEKLGTEIARITERLAERIANSERRSALAIDDVGEQVARVTERITQRQERVSVDLSERIRQSEERTARLLDEAREKIDASLSSAHKKLAEQVTTAQAPATPKPRAFIDPFAAAPFPDEAEEAFAPQAFSRAETQPAPPPFEAAAFPAPEPEPAFSPEDIEAADGFEAAGAAADGRPAIPEPPDIPPAPRIAPMEIDEPTGPPSTRQVIEQARAAARAAAQPETKGRKGAEGGTTLFSGLKPGRKKRQAGATLKTALFVTGAAAALGAGVASYMLGVAEPGGRLPERVERNIEVAGRDAVEVQASEADTAPEAAPADGQTEAAQPRMAVALSPQSILNPPKPGDEAKPAAKVEPAPAPQNAAALYAEGVRRIEADDATGLEPLRKAANLGNAQAQFYLAKLYETGEAGLKKDATAARRWTERAAQGGDRKAMHNLALYYFEGQGGPKNSTTAALWFRKAADLGLTDSQYNLGRLYEEGYGVSQNTAEAYKWYLIAGRSGDGEAKSSAERVKKGLSAEARAAAERSAAGYRAAAGETPAQASAAGSVVTAQKALSRLGYYQGPQDGKTSPALKLAVSAYQRDQGLRSDGELNGELVMRLSAYAR